MANQITSFHSLETVAQLTLNFVLAGKGADRHQRPNFTREEPDILVREV